MRRPEQPSDEPNIQAIHFFGMIFFAILMVLLAAVLSAIPVSIAMGLGYLLSRWFMVSFVQGTAFVLGSMVVAGLFMWGYRLSDRLGDLENAVYHLASKRLLFTGPEGLDENDDDPWEDE